jgi:hypothetical protein
MDIDDDKDEFDVLDDKDKIILLQKIRNLESLEKIRKELKNEGLTEKQIKDKLRTQYNYVKNY